MLAFYSLLTFASLNLLMYSIYGWPFLEHSYLYHLIRSDHRHNFSPYSTILYLSSSPKPSGLHSAPPSFGLERLAFLPQLLLSAVFIPLELSKKDLPYTMLAQTFAFVTFNKVCTSQVSLEHSNTTSILTLQYFLWYMMFLPYYLPQSTLLQSPSIGVFALLSWIAGQAAWLFQGFQLEFNGNSTFVPALWIATILFFIINVGILSVIINDTKQKPVQAVVSQKKKL